MKYFQLFTRNNHTCCAEQRMAGRKYRATLAGLAEALDDAALADIEQRGYSGAGAGAWVEAIFDDEEKNIVVAGLDDASLLTSLSTGIERRRLRRAIRLTEQQQVWDGRNFISLRAAALRELDAKFSTRTEQRREK